LTTQNTEIKAWIDARKRRNISDVFILHSDRGVQYASNKMTNLCNFNLKITQSMSRKGNCWDNAVTQSFFKSITYECYIGLNLLCIINHISPLMTILFVIIPKDNILV
jgi:putative transposase